MLAYRLVQPCVKDGASHPQSPTHQRNGVVMAVLVHEAVLHSGSLAKYRAALLGNTSAICSRFEVIAKRSGPALQIRENTTVVLSVMRCYARILI